MSSCSGLCATAPRTPHPPELVTAATTSRQWLKPKIGTSMPTSSDAEVRTGNPFGQWFSAPTAPPPSCPPRSEGSEPARGVIEQVLAHRMALLQCVAQQLFL